ncbi:hypothetical protein LZ31DRAFT_310243 [Colletotrichum somersetense]|nr:hypothetical protein LZ31DRAFT_310243 [Colletotrichum somersetense]
MEAELWGQVDIVKSLLRTGANPRLTDNRDMSAADYADERLENDKERIQRHVSYVENPYLTKRDRAGILALLGPPPATPLSNRLTYTINDFGDWHFHKCPEYDIITFFLPVLEIPIAYQYKTAAILCRRDPFAPCLAVSGWSDRVQIRH